MRAIATYVSRMPAVSEAGTAAAAAVAAVAAVEAELAASRLDVNMRRGLVGAVDGNIPPPERHASAVGSKQLSAGGGGGSSSSKAARRASKAERELRHLPAFHTAGRAHIDAALRHTAVTTREALKPNRAAQTRWGLAICLVRVLRVLPMLHMPPRAAYIALTSPPPLPLRPPPRVCACVCVSTGAQRGHRQRLSPSRPARDSNRAPAIGHLTGWGGVKGEQSPRPPRSDSRRPIGFTSCSRCCCCCVGGCCC